MLSFLKAVSWPEVLLTKFNNGVYVLWNLQNKQSGQHQIDIQNGSLFLLAQVPSLLDHLRSLSTFKICEGPKILVLSLCYFFQMYKSQMHTFGAVMSIMFKTGVLRNIDMCSSNVCCSGKAVGVAYSEWVSVAVGMPHAMCTQNIIIL